jgi:hypothetical protein
MFVAETQSLLCHLLVLQDDLQVAGHDFEGLSGRVGNRAFQG